MAEIMLELLTWLGLTTPPQTFGDFLYFICTFFGGLTILLFVIDGIFFAIRKGGRF